MIVLVFSLKKVQDNAMYRGKESKGLLNQQMKEQENKIVDEKWMKGEGAEDLVGRSYDGKQIKSAKPLFEGGVFGFGKTFQGWDVEFADGTFGEIPAERDEVASVFTGKKKQVDFPVVDSEESYNKLEPGAEYVDVDGKKHRKGGASKVDAAVEAFRKQQKRDPSAAEMKRIKAKYE